MAKFLVEFQQSYTYVVYTLSTTSAFVLEIIVIYYYNIMHRFVIAIVYVFNTSPTHFAKNSAKRINIYVYC